jgi:hypothetical protein
MTAGIARNAATAVGFGGSLPRPRMQLLAWKRIDKGALIGRAAVLLPNEHGPISGGSP